MNEAAEAELEEQEEFPNLYGTEEAKQYETQAIEGEHFEKRDLKLPLPEPRKEWNHKPQSIDG